MKFILFALFAITLAYQVDINVDINQINHPVELSIYLDTNDRSFKYSHNLLNETNFDDDSLVTLKVDGEILRTYNGKIGKSNKWIPALILTIIFTAPIATVVPALICIKIFRK